MNSPCLKWSIVCLAGEWSNSTSHWQEDSANSVPSAPVYYWRSRLNSPVFWDWSELREAASQRQSIIPSCTTSTYNGLHGACRIQVLKPQIVITRALKQSCRLARSRVPLYSTLALYNIYYDHLLAKKASNSSAHWKIERLYTCNNHSKGGEWVQINITLFQSNVYSIFDSLSIVEIATQESRGTAAQSYTSLTANHMADGYFTAREIHFKQSRNESLLHGYKTFRECEMEEKKIKEKTTLRGVDGLLEMDSGGCTLVCCKNNSFNLHRNRQQRHYHGTPACSTCPHACTKSTHTHTHSLSANNRSGRPH